MATPLPPEAEAGEARELLYEAYNELQALASELGGAAVAPAVVVVGHQTDGKSALVEALMGFQFNHVGGGTKTRRPVALHLRFNPRCDEPQCRLLSAAGDADEHDGAGVAARPMPLADIQVRTLHDAARNCLWKCRYLVCAPSAICTLQRTPCVCVIACVLCRKEDLGCCRWDLPLRR
jgi:hypothetical protein